MDGSPNVKTNWYTLRYTVLTLDSPECIHSMSFPSLRIMDSRLDVPAQMGCIRLENIHMKINETLFLGKNVYAKNIETVSLTNGLF